jgi:ABC-type transport system involved in multi-copper enzyme maturation permease subunit
VLKLMKLEMKKYKIGGFLNSVWIANIAILVLMVMLNYVPDSKKEVGAYNFLIEIQTIDLLVRNTFIIFAAVLLAKIIIDEYKSKTITVLFMYPINRYKLFLSKILITVIFTFVVIILSDIIISGTFYIINIFEGFVPREMDMAKLYKLIISIIITAGSTSFISLIPLFFGMWKKSTIATIVSAIILVSVVGSNNGGVSLGSMLGVQLVLSIIGIFIAYLGIRNIEKRDVA